MDATTHQKWLHATRKFWNADSEFQAKYRRICASEEFCATTDETKLDQLWKRDTRRAVKGILKDIPMRSDWTCVEIGCGVGRLLKPIAKHCRRVIGVDISERMVDWAAHYLADVPNAEVRLNDGTSLPSIADETVDFVYSYLAFQHITRIEVVDAYIAEIARVLKNGGYCRIQNWREPPRPAIQAVKDVLRPLLRREKYHSPRYWTWSEGRDVEFGGMTFRPHQWKTRLATHGLKTISLELGEGHDFWMWTTSVRASR